MIRILIVDDHNVVCQGLTLILENNGEMKVVASCTNGANAMSWLFKNDCDVVIADISMPGMSGIDLLKYLRKDKPKLPVLIFSAHPEDQLAVRLIKAGAAGYLNKECAPDEVVKAVNCVMQGKRYISPAVAEMLANVISMSEEKITHENLSNREYQIFILISSGHSLTEIADTLKLSVKTIGTYRSRIIEKMGMINNADMMRYAIDNNLM